MAVSRTYSLQELNRGAIGPRRLGYRSTLKKLLVLITAKNKENFAGSHGPDGQPWAPLKKPSKRRGGGRARPLRDRGILMASVTSQQGPGNVTVITDTSLEHGSNLDYAGYQQDGTRHIPARPFIGISDRTADLMAEIVADDTERQIGDMF